MIESAHYCHHCDQRCPSSPQIQNGTAVSRPCKDWPTHHRPIGNDGKCNTRAHTGHGSIEALNPDYENNSKGGAPETHPHVKPEPPCKWASAKRPSPPLARLRQRAIVKHKETGHLGTTGGVGPRGLLVNTPICRERHSLRAQWPRAVP